MSRRPAPYCVSGPRWVADRIFTLTGDKHALAPLTGQDSRALAAFMHLVDLYGVSDNTGRSCAVAGMAACICAMQRSTRHLAKSVIPHVLDWGDEGPLWQRVERAAANLLTPAVDLPVGELERGQ